jgi:hypothetical protein
VSHKHINDHRENQHAEETLELLKTSGYLLSMLLLGAAALSKYALAGLLADIAPTYFQADIVQVVAEVGKAVPAELGTVLQAARPSFLLISPAALSAKLRKGGLATSTLQKP